MNLRLATGVLLLALAPAACQADKPAAETTATTPAGARTVLLDLDALPAGPAPRIGWRHGREIHDGDKVVTVDADIDAFVLTRKRLITETFGDAGTSIDVRDADGRSTAGYPISSGHPVLSDDRTMVAWVDPDITPMVLQDGQAKPLAMPKPADAAGGPESIGEAVALRGPNCADAEVVEGAGCAVYFNWYHDPKSEGLISSSHGFVDVAGSGQIHRLFDVSIDQAYIGDDGAGVENPRIRYESDETKYFPKNFAPLSFSPDGSKLLALPAVLREGPAASTVSIRAAETGALLLTAKSPPDHFTIWETVWEDDTHLLSVVQQGEGRWGIVRWGLDGKAELAVKPLKDTVDAPALGLAIQP